MPGDRDGGSLKSIKRRSQVPFNSTCKDFSGIMSSLLEHNIFEFQLECPIDNITKLSKPFLRCFISLECFKPALKAAWIFYVSQIVLLA